MTSPAQILRDPHERSTRANAPLDSTAPPGRAVVHTSPGSTFMDVRTRPDGDRASTDHGRSGSVAGSTSGLTPCGSDVATVRPLIRIVTVRVVPFEIPSFGWTTADDPGADEQPARINPKISTSTVGRID